MGVIQDFVNYTKEVKAYTLAKKSTTLFNASKFFPFDITFSKSNNLTRSYESNVDAYSVLRKITDVFKSIPWVVEQIDREGNWVQVENTTVNELLKSPNVGKGYTMQDIDEQMVIYLFGNGNSYLHGEELSGKIAEIDVLPSMNVEAITNTDFFMPNVRYQFEFGTNKRTYDNKELEHIMLFNPSYDSTKESFNGLSAFEVAKYVVEVGNDRWKADAHLLKNRGIAGMVTNSSNRPLLPGEAEKIQGAFDLQNSGTDNFGRVKVTNQDLKYIQMGMSSTDLELIKKGVITLRAMCNVFGLDSSLFNDPANKTFNNRAEAEKAMYTNVIIPLAEKIGMKHTNFIAKNHFPLGDVRIRKSFENIPVLQKDKKSEAEKDKIEVEGMNVVLNMPIDNDSKIQLLKETFEISEELERTLKTTNNE